MLVLTRQGAAKSIETDASDTAIGGVLPQEEPDDEWRPIAFLAK